MKPVIILAITLLFSFLANAQESSTYRTLEDLLANRPADNIPSGFRYKRQRHQGKIRGEKIAAYRFKGPKGFKLPREKTFAVYMDGLLFINPERPKLRKSTDFFKVEWIGNYGYFVDIHDYPVWVDEVYMEETVLKEKLVDRTTGDIIDLSKKNLRIILQDHPQLLKEFEAEKNKKRQLKAYLVLLTEQT